MAKIVNTDNYGSDYPDEKFIEGLPPISETALKEICKILNRECGQYSSRYYKVEPDDYELQPGFEP